MSRPFKQAIIFQFINLNAMHNSQPYKAKYVGLFH